MEKKIFDLSLSNEKRIYYKPEIRVECIEIEQCLAAGSGGEGYAEMTAMQTVWEEEEIIGGIEL